MFSDDKPENEVRREMPRSTGALRITHPEKLLYPEKSLTKADVAAYIERVAPLMWPYMKDRFVSLVRCPEGVGGGSFFQRHLRPGFGKRWKEQDYISATGNAERYIYATSKEALVDAIQMNTLEFHLWGSRRDKPDIADRIVFDLDPGPDVDFPDIRYAALRLRDVLNALGLASFPMLSGSKGIHVIISIRRQYHFSIVKQFTKDIARHLADDEPNRFTDVMSKSKRHRRIFIDYFRNEVEATAIAPYSPRARQGAGVAWPCHWEELDQYDASDAMTVPLALNALEGRPNPWGGIKPQILSSAALRTVAKN